MKKFFVLLLALSMALSCLSLSYSLDKVIDVKTENCNQDENCPMASFIDLDLSSWYHDGIHFVLSKGLMKGMNEKCFKPNMLATRGQVISILWRYCASPKTKTAKELSDLSNQYYAEAASWAYAKGIAKGYEDGEFKGDNNITREQFAVMLYQSIKRDDEIQPDWMFLLDYDDSNLISAWADEAVHWCVLHKILSGKSEGMLDPKGFLTRAEAAAMIKRLDDLGIQMK